MFREHTAGLKMKSTELNEDNTDTEICISSFAASIKLCFALKCLQ